MIPDQQSVPVVSTGGRLVVQEDVSFAVSPVASHLQAGTDDEQISATETNSNYNLFSVRQPQLDQISAQTDPAHFLFDCLHLTTLVSFGFCGRIDVFCKKQSNSPEHVHTGL